MAVLLAPTRIVPSASRRCSVRLCGRVVSRRAHHRSPCSRRRWCCVKVLETDRRVGATADVIRQCLITIGGVVQPDKLLKSDISAVGSVLSAYNIAE